MNGRTRWVDVAKTLGIFAIVLGHTVGEGAVMRYLYSFHIPLFFFLSGATFRVKGSAFGTFVKKRVLSLLVPYGIFALLSQLVYEAMRRMASGAIQSDRAFSSGAAWLRILLGYVEANRALWFLPCLFLMSLMLFPIVKRLEEGTPMPAYAAIAASVLFSIVNVYILKIREWPWKLDVAVQLMCFALAGRLAAERLRHISIPRPAMLAVSAVLLALGGVSGVFWNERIKYLGGVYGSLPVFYLSSIASVLGVCLLCICIGRNRALEYVGGHTLAILVMHKFPILFFQWVCPGVKGWMASGGLPVEIAVVIVSIVLCCIAERIILKICPVLLGRKKTIAA